MDKLYRCKIKKKIQLTEQKFIDLNAEWKSRNILSLIEIRFVRLANWACGIDR